MAQQMETLQHLFANSEAERSNTDRRLGDGDAYIMVETDFDGKVTGMRMARIDPEADFSFDFQDLDFERVD